MESLKLHNLHFAVCVYTLYIIYYIYIVYTHYILYIYNQNSENNTANPAVFISSSDASFPNPLYLQLAHIGVQPFSCV